MQCSSMTFLPQALLAILLPECRYCLEKIHPSIKHDKVLHPLFILLGFPFQDEVSMLVPCYDTHPKKATHPEHILHLKAHSIFTFCCQEGIPFLDLCLHVCV